MEQMDWIGWTCWAVIGVSAAVSLWALFWDRARGRLRCRKCAYDMSGGGLTCPECGREHKSEKELKKTRRRWKTAVVGLVLLVFAIHAKMSRRFIENEGVLGLIPSSALILATQASDYPDYVFGGYSPGSRLAHSLCERIDSNETSLFTRRLFAKKVATSWSGLQIGVHNSDAYSVVYDLSGITPLESITRITPCFPPLDGGPWPVHVSNELSMHVFESVAEHAHPESWAFYGGDQSAELYVGDQLVVSASQEVHELLSRHFAEIAHNVWSPGNGPSIKSAGQYCFVRYKMDWVPCSEDSYSEVFKLYDAVEQEVRPESWEFNGGQSAMHQIGMDMLVWAPADHQVEIAAYLDSAAEQIAAGQTK